MYGLVIIHIDDMYAPVVIVHGYIGDPSSLESVTGRTLFDSREEGKAMKAMHRLHLVHAIVMCLMAIHEVGVVSIDIKADNIMARKDSEGLWKIQLIDFGLATYKSSKACLTFPTTTTIFVSTIFIITQNIEHNVMEHKYWYII